MVKKRKRKRKNDSTQREDRQQQQEEKRQTAQREGPPLRKEGRRQTEEMSSTEWQPQLKKLELKKLELELKKEWKRKDFEWGLASRKRPRKDGRVSDDRWAAWEAGWRGVGAEWAEEPIHAAQGLAE